MYMYEILFKNKNNEVIFSQQLDCLVKASAVKEYWVKVGKFKGQDIFSITITQI